MIDLHAHILPGLDDGPRDLDAAAAFARAAVAEGTAVLAATSHVDPVFSLRPSDLARARAAVRERLREDGIELDVVAGGEIAAARLRDLDDDELDGLRLGGGPYVLLEAPLGPFSADEFGALVADLQARGFRVLIAHPERAPLFQRAPERLGRPRRRRSAGTGHGRRAAGRVRLPGAPLRGRPAARRARARGRVRRPWPTPPAGGARRFCRGRARAARRSPAGAVDGARRAGRDPRRRSRPRAPRAAARAAQPSFVIAITMPASTKITISACTQIQNGDTPPD